MERFELTSADGTRLAGYRWEPEGEPVADVLLAHGGFEHLGRYEHVAAALTGAGYRVTGVDVRGHGHSEGPRGHVDTWQHYVDDLAAVAAHIGGPYFLVAHSMGTLISLDFLRTAEGVRGFVASGPLLEPAVVLPWWKHTAAGVLSRLTPGLTLANEIPTTDLSTDPATVAAYEADELVYGFASARWYTEMNDARERVWAHQGRYTVPAYFTWGSDDRLVSPAAAARFAQGYGGPCTHREWPGLRHEIFNEVIRDEVLATVLQWLDHQREASA